MPGNAWKNRSRFCVRLRSEKQQSVRVSIGISIFRRKCCGTWSNAPASHFTRRKIVSKRRAERTQLSKRVGIKKRSRSACSRSRTIYVGSGATRAAGSTKFTSRDATWQPDHARKSKPGHLRIGDDGMSAGDRQRCDHHLGWRKRELRAERELLRSLQPSDCYSHRSSMSDVEHWLLKTLNLCAREKSKFEISSTANSSRPLRSLSCRAKSRHLSIFP
jgi:hypothetical protein